MTTPIYRINSGQTVHGVESIWEEEPLRLNDSGVAEYSPWKKNIWRTGKMAMITFLELEAQQGQPLTLLETNDVTDLNNGAQYTNAIVGPVSGRHIGLNVHDVTVEFRVKT